MDTPVPNPDDVLRSRNYAALLVIAAAIGIPITIFAYFFLYLMSQLQKLLYTTIPGHFASHALQTWWPIIPLTIAGLLVGLIVTWLPGKGGDTPIEGFKAGGGPPARSFLIGITLAAFISIGFGAVVGPEAPLIALGSGLAYAVVKSIYKNLPQNAGRLVAGAGSFSAISTLFGNPLSGAFLLMEVSGLGGLLMEIALLPGILAAGIGLLVFVGLNSLTGFGLFSLTIPKLPPYGSPTIGEFTVAIAMGVIAPLAVAAIRWLGTRWSFVLQKRVVIYTVLAGAATGLLAALFTATTGHSYAYVLFSGQNELPFAVASAGALSVGALLFILLFKGIAYAVALASFRGGPTFPAIYLGAVAGILLTHISGIALAATLAIGIGAMTAAMLQLPLTTILLTALLLGPDGIRTLPLTIVAVVVSYVLNVRLNAKRLDAKD